jgi:hypothetical protein
MQRNLLKKIVSVFILGFGLMYAVNAQDNAGRNPDGTKGSSGRSSSAKENVKSIVIYNETPFKIKNIFIYKADDTDWGKNLLANPIFNKERVTISLDNSYDKSALYTIRLMDDGGEYYTKNNVSLTDRGRISLDIYDLEQKK